MIVDLDWQNYWESRAEDILSDAETLQINDEGFIKSIGQKAQSIDEIEGQYIGLIKFKGKGIQKMLELVNEEREANSKGTHVITEKRNLKNLYMTDLLQGLIDRGQKVKPVNVNGNWLEIDTESDLMLARSLSEDAGDLLKIKR